MMDLKLTLLLEEIKSLPYGRNADRSDFNLVPIEKKGSCSTKHAYIKSMATKKGWANVKLILCIYMMNAENTPGVANVLRKHQLKEIPEAHTFLEIEGEVVDVTGLTVSNSTFEEKIVLKEEIRPEQIGDYKINFHKEFINQWATQTNYSPTELWTIREECITALCIK